jgi:hypothetical protein
VTDYWNWTCRLQRPSGDASAKSTYADVPRDWNYDHQQARVQSERSEMREDDKEQSGSTHDNAFAEPAMTRWLEETMLKQPYHGIKAVRIDDEEGEQTPHT